MVGRLSTSIDDRTGDYPDIPKMRLPLLSAINSTQGAKQIQYKRFPYQQTIELKRTIDRNKTYNLWKHLKSKAKSVIKDCVSMG